MVYYGEHNQCVYTKHITMFIVVLHPAVCRYHTFLKLASPGCDVDDYSEVYTSNLTYHCTHWPVSFPVILNSHYYHWNTGFVLPNKLLHGHE